MARGAEARAARLEAEAAEDDQDDEDAIQEEES
jgi:hypothetical protein